MNNQEIVAKLWNLCNVLRDDGITYHEYVTELTYILFLKMCKETGSEEAIPEGYRWDSLTSRSGLELKKHYQTLLSFLGENCTGRVREIYQGAQTKIDEPKNLEKIITTIDQFDWFTAKEEGLGNLYEGLLEKNANEKKSGAGQYFTPRVLINVMTRLIAPQPGELCNDPACGTFGFMIAADAYVKSITDDLFSLSLKMVIGQCFVQNPGFSLPPTILSHRFRFFLIQKNLKMQCVCMQQDMAATKSLQSGHLSKNGCTANIKNTWTNFKMETIN